MTDSGVWDAIVVGAGVHGLCAALHLRARLPRVAVVERFDLDHEAGSSHGASRIMRSSYHDPLYVRMAQAASRAWPELGRVLHSHVLTPTPGVFFGPDSPRLRAFAAATLGSGADVEEIDAETARSRFPLLQVGDDCRVLLDHTAGVLAAADITSSLRRTLAAQGVNLLSHTAVHALVSQPEAVLLATAGGGLRARHVLLACGAWIAGLVPELATWCRVLRQVVGYYELDAPPAAWRAPRFPVWARIGALANDFVYGLPAIAASGVKVARHRTEGEADALEGQAAAGVLADVDALAGAHLACRVRRQRSETCLYTMTPEQHFLVDASPHDARVVVLSACSGHGFKFAPVVGKLAAEIALDRARPPAAFAWPRSSGREA